MGLFWPSRVSPAPFGAVVRIRACRDETGALTARPTKATRTESARRNPCSAMKRSVARCFVRRAAGGRNCRDDACPDNFRKP